MHHRPSHQRSLHIDRFLERSIRRFERAEADSEEAQEIALGSSSETGKIQPPEVVVADRTRGWDASPATTAERMNARTVLPQAEPTAVNEQTVLPQAEPTAMSEQVLRAPVEATAMMWLRP